MKTFDKDCLLFANLDKDMLATNKCLHFATTRVINRKQKIKQSTDILRNDNKPIVKSYLMSGKQRKTCEPR